MNEPEVLTPIIEKRNDPATNKANALSAQAEAIAAASVGSSVFRSAATYLADHPVIKGYK